MCLTKLKKELRQLSDPKKAKILQGFFKTGKGQYGEGDVFLGVTVPKQRALAKRYWQSLSLADLGKLIKSKIHEERLLALLMLGRKYYYASTPAQSKKEIFRFYLKHTELINNWDLVDLSAPNIVGAYLLDKDKTILFKLAKSKNLWERRIAILATFYFIQKGKPKETLKIAKMLLCDKHDLVHKATGWMLREAGKRCGENVLTGFLDRHHRQMPRTMLRYALERLPEAKRKAYLKSFPR